ncbi:RDD family protein [Massilia sp. TS11]|uniref:RDD family protein n=1 Tax=Massilia sp. TS11 TaxID=2908003 RepID=UPI001EDA2601|nr:RDD family protein [Massilia sp. TS11]MCG2583206.1 RDD family protein [Massilia sp. TS11]
MQNNPTPALQFPSIGRRLICMVYESFLLTAVMMLAVAAFLILSGNRHSPLLDHVRTLWVFLAGGAYFVHQWRDSGHTLAMKTWRIKLVLPGAAKLPFKVAFVRYVLIVSYFLPALLAYSLLDIHSGRVMSALLLASLALMLLAPLFTKDRQFLHDRLLGTYLIQLPKRTK